MVRSIVCGHNNLNIQEGVFENIEDALKYYESLYPQSKRGFTPMGELCLVMSENISIDFHYLEDEVDTLSKGMIVDSDETPF